MTPTPLEATLADFWRRLRPVPKALEGNSGLAPLRTGNRQRIPDVAASVPNVPTFPSNSKAPSAGNVINQLDGEFEERAAILEYEAGLPRPEAERRAAQKLGRV